ncbi:MAG: large repetitive protein, partial [Mycobacterium sp.]|nr:large repetitive protein [Mycobacterium sp.]
MAGERSRRGGRCKPRHRRNKRSGGAQATYPAFRIGLDNAVPINALTAVTSANYARYVGRVGALAVALGVGAAVSTGHGIGVARADTDAPSKDSSATDASKDPTSASSTTTTQSTESTTTTQSTSPSAEQTSASTSGESGSSPTHTTKSPPEMQVSGSGGLNTSTNDDGQATNHTKTEEPSTPAHSEPETTAAATTTPPTPESTTTPQSRVEEGSSVPIEAPEKTPPPPTLEMTPSEISPPAQDSAAGSSHERTQSTASPISPDESTEMRLMSVFDETEATPADGERSFSLSTMHVASFSAPLAPLPPPTPLQALTAIPNTPVSIASTFVAALLSPWLAPGPVAPSQPPFLLVVLGWESREVQRTFFNRSP